MWILVYPLTPRLCGRVMRGGHGLFASECGELEILFGLEKSLQPDQLTRKTLE